MMSALPFRLLITRLTNGNRTERWEKIGEGRSFEANREYVDPNCPIGEDEIEVVAVQAAFSREVTAEIEGVVAGLEADEIVFAK